MLQVNNRQCSLLDIDDALRHVHESRLVPAETMQNSDIPWEFGQDNLGAALWLQDAQVILQYRLSTRVFCNEGVQRVCPAV
jgi:hypothetical protein